MEFFKTIRQAVAEERIPVLIDVLKAQFEKKCLLNDNIRKQIELDKEKKNVKKSVAEVAPNIETL